MAIGMQIGANKLYAQRLPPGLSLQVYDVDTTQRDLYNVGAIASGEAGAFLFSESWHVEYPQKLAISHFDGRNVTTDIRDWNYWFELRAVMNGGRHSVIRFQQNNQSTYEEFDFKTGKSRMLPNVATGTSLWEFLPVRGGYVYDNGAQVYLVDGLADVTHQIVASGRLRQGNNNRITIGTNTFFGIGQGLFVSDGTVAGTRKIQDLEGYLERFSRHGEGVIVRTTRELLYTDGTRGGTRTILRGDAAARVTRLARSGDRTICVYDDTEKGHEWFRIGERGGSFERIEDLAEGSSSGVIDKSDGFTYDELLPRTIFRGRGTDGTERLYEVTNDGVRVVPGGTSIITNTYSFMRPIGVDQNGDLIVRIEQNTGLVDVTVVPVDGQARSLGSFARNRNSFKVYTGSNTIVVQEEIDYTKSKLSYGVAPNYELKPIGVVQALSPEDVTQINGRLFFNRDSAGGGYVRSWLDMASGVITHTNFNQRDERFQDLFAMGSRTFGALSPQLGGGLQNKQIYELGSNTLDLISDIFDSNQGIAGLNSGAVYLQEGGDKLAVSARSALHVFDKYSGERRRVAFDNNRTAPYNFSKLAHLAVAHSRFTDTAIVVGSTYERVIHEKDYRTVATSFAYLDGYVYYLAQKYTYRPFSYRTKLWRFEDKADSPLELVYEFSADNTIEKGLNLLADDGHLYFTLPSSYKGAVLGRSDGTSKGTQVYEKFTDSPVSSEPALNRMAIAEGFIYIELEERTKGNIRILDIQNNNKYQLDINFNQDLRFRNINRVFRWGTYFAVDYGADVYVIDATAGRAVRIDKADHQSSVLLNRELAVILRDTVKFYTIPGELSRAVVLDPYEGTGHIFGNYLISRGKTYTTYFRNLHTGIKIEVEGFQLQQYGYVDVTPTDMYFTADTYTYGYEPHRLSISKSRLISGEVFEDTNGNGARDAGEAGLAGRIVESSYANRPGVRTILTDSLGRFRFTAAAGQALRLRLLTPDCAETPVKPKQVDIAPDDQNVDGIRFGESPLTGAVAIFQAATTLSQNRCNELSVMTLSLKNEGCAKTTVTTELSLPRGVTVLRVGGPIDTSGNTLRLSYDLVAGASIGKSVLLQMPDETRTGDLLKFQVAHTYLPDGTGSSTTFRDSVLTTLRCAYDPNDKLVTPNRADPDNQLYTQYDEELRYTIRFQNTGNDTARDVRLLDRLATEIDTSTFRVMGASHGYSYEFTDARTLNVYFHNINLVDSAASFPRSCGFFSYVVHLKSGAKSGTVANTASIYFDRNAPIITNTTTNTIVEYLDRDNDGSMFWLDCDDTDASIYPGAPDEPGNGIDEDCDRQDGVSGINEIADLGLRVFPNPTRTSVEISTTAVGSIRIELYDVNGRNLGEYSQRTIDLTPYPVGVFVLILTEQSSGRRQVTRVTKL